MHATPPRGNGKHRLDLATRGNGEPRRASEPSAGAGSRCAICDAESVIISRRLGVCGRCVTEEPKRALPAARATHREMRRSFGLPEQAPHAARGVPCAVCVHECDIGVRQRGLCNLRENQRGRMIVHAGDADAAVLRWTRRRLPARCVAMELCGERASRDRESLVVSYGTCSLDCLYCNAWHWAEDAAAVAPRVGTDELADATGDSVACISHTGGDVAQQAPYALVASRDATRRRPVRICWETNGTSHPMYMKIMVDTSLDSGGTITFDLKAWSDALHIALTGHSNQRTLENFATAARRSRTRPEPPLVVASTLLVPGYVDADEVAAISRFIASIDAGIPYRLLPFEPAFLMDDLPPTARSHADRCVAAARGAGLRDAAVLNESLLGAEY